MKQNKAKKKKNRASLGRCTVWRAALTTFSTYRLTSCDPPGAHQLVRDLKALLLAAVDNVIVLIFGGGTMDDMIRKRRQLLPNGYYEYGELLCAPDYSSFCKFW